METVVIVQRISRGDQQRRARLPERVPAPRACDRGSAAQLAARISPYGFDVWVHMMIDHYCYIFCLTLVYPANDDENSVSLFKGFGFNSDMVSNQSPTLWL
jgi:hypothetical protein